MYDPLAFIYYFQELKSKRLIQSYIALNSLISLKPGLLLYESIVHHFFINEWFKSHVSVSYYFLKVKNRKTTISDWTLTSVFLYALS
nr:hyp [Cotesia vestalis bracovirus]